jgi:FkbM family methyltransferase
VNQIDQELRKIIEPEGKFSHFESILKCIYFGLIRSDSTVIDVGAQFGLHTFRFAERIGLDGQIFSFEIVPQFVQHIQKKAAEKYKEPNQIKVFNLAVSNTDDVVTFYQNDKNNGQSTIVEGHGIDFDQTSTSRIQSITLDAFFDFDKIGRLDFIKCDAESADFDVLRGAKNLIQAKDPLFIMEFEMDQLGLLGVSKEDFFNFLETNDFLAYSIDGRPFTNERIENNDQPFCYEIAVVNKRSDKKNFAEKNMPSIVWNWIKHTEWH